jgi:hypothetical protein
LLKLEVINVNQKFIYDQTTDTHIFMNRGGLYYSLTVRSPYATYLNGTGVLVTGCSSSSVAFDKNRLVVSAQNDQNCIVCDDLFLTDNNTDVVVGENEIHPRLLLEMCRMDCALLGNPSFAQMLVQTNASVGFAFIGDQEKNTTLLVEEIQAALNSSTSTSNPETTQSNDFSTSKTFQKTSTTTSGSSFVWKNSFLFNFILLVLILISFQSFHIEFY